MNVSDFDFVLPEHLIAQYPIQQRDHSRLLVVNPNEDTIADEVFSSIIDYLNPGDVLVRNNTKVIPARLLGIKKQTGAHVELLMLRQIDDIWECLVGNARVVKIGTQIVFGNGELTAECVQIGEEGIRFFKMIYQGVFLETLERLGNMPLPPYIHERLEDSSRYQTVYAKESGSAAAPTAGLHFTPELLARIESKGIEIIDVTLHIGLGTFRPVKVDKVEDHPMHEEYFYVTEQSASRLNAALNEKRRIIAVGTTALRVLESQMSMHGKFVAEYSSTRIFIYPGYVFKATDAIITNFHLPKSTLLMLVYAFGGTDLMKRAYQHAVDSSYRFFSFGDSMFIDNKRKSSV